MLKSQVHDAAHQILSDVISEDFLRTDLKIFLTAKEATSAIRHR